MRILIAGYYGFGNLGDELILSSIITQIKARSLSPDFTVLSANPAETDLRHRIRAVSRWNPFIVFSEIWRNDFLVVGGGGLLQNKTSQRSLLYYLSLIGVARILQCPVVLFAMGVETLQGRFARGLTRLVLSGEKVKITVRDDASKEILSQIGVPASSVHVTADPVFARTVSASPRERYAFSSASTALLIPRFPCPPAGRRLFAILGRILREDKKMNVRGLLFQPQTEMEEVDSFNGESILSTHDFIYGLSLDEMTAEIPKYDWIVSARFHGLVLAALAGRPFVGVGDPHKVGRLCALLKMPFLPWDSTEHEISAAIEKVALKNFEVQKPIIDRLRAAALQTASHVG